MGLIEFLNSLDEILFLNLVNWGPDSLDYFFQVLSMSIGTYVLVNLSEKSITELNQDLEEE